MRWPKPWHNLRSTRETELAETFPIQVVCDWIGNSQAVAREHYLQVTEEHFDRATDCSSLQKALQQNGKSPCNAVQENEETPEKHAFSRTSRGLRMGVAGLEPATSTV